MSGYTGDYDEKLQNIPGVAARWCKCRCWQEAVDAEMLLSDRIENDRTRGVMMMNTREPKLLLLFVSLITLISVVGAGCAAIQEYTEDKAYLTPVPQATLSAFRTGKPVTTRQQAVVAAQQDLLFFHLDWIGQPAVIFAEKMDYVEAVERSESPEPETSYDPTPAQLSVWLVVFEGEWTLTGPLGTPSAPISGCAYVIINAEDGSGMRTGGNLCAELDVE